MTESATITFKSISIVYSIDHRYFNEAKVIRINISSRESAQLLIKDSINECGYLIMR